MTLSAHMVAEGPGWSIADVVCTAGPLDRPFEERHADVCVAVVVSGTFQYRNQQAKVTFAPGALLLGNVGTCFECSHEHGVGDRCLSFHFEPGWFDNIVASMRISDAIRLIEGKSDEPITLAGLARAVAMSPYHFLRTFRAVTGVTPYQFILGQRLRQAAARLRQTADPIVDIAFDAGFGDLSTFNRRFRRIMGKTPSAWRIGR
jgi:AraC family transcriptional regulator